MTQGSGLILTSPIRRPVRRTGVTFLEVVFSAVILAMAAAALLRARTGTPESPGTVLRMAGVH